MPTDTNKAVLLFVLSMAPAHSTASAQRSEPAAVGDAVPLPEDQYLPDALREVVCELDECLAQEADHAQAVLLIMAAFILIGWHQRVPTGTKGADVTS